MVTKTEIKVEKPVSRRKIEREEIDKTNGFTPRVHLLKQAFLDARNPIVSGERAYYWMESHQQTDSEHTALRYAKAFRNTLENISICIRDNELVVGGQTKHIRGAHPRVESYPRQILRRVQAQEVTTSSSVNVAIMPDEDKEKLIQAAEYWTKYWEPKVPRRKDSEGKKIRAAQAECRLRFSMGMWQGEEDALQALGVTPNAPGADHARVINEGLNSIIAEARENIKRIRSKPREEYTNDDEDRIKNLEAMIIAMEAMITFAHRHADLAREMAAKETNETRKKELLKIAEVCDWVPANPARTFWEALQTHWFILIGQDMEKTTANSYCGRFDQYCYPCYERDINEGRLTRQEAAELLGCMFMKWQSLEAFSEGDFQALVPGSYLANVTVGGIGRDGKDASNELSCLVLHVAKQAKTNQPHISLRWHRAMSPDLLDKAIECTRDHGAGIPAWFNDRHAIEYLCDRGIPQEEARDWSVLGCINFNICHLESNNWGMGSLGFVNHPKLLEFALYRGIDSKTGVKLGPDTGDPRNFKTFDEMLEAYRKQIDHYYESNIRRGFKAAKLLDPLCAYVPFTSSLLNEPIKKGKDYNHGGARFWKEHQGAVWVDRGLPDAADSLAALKKVVFDDKQATMGEVIDALKADFEGYEELRAKLLAAPKYGNDDDYADNIMSYFWRYTVDLGMSYRDTYGRRPVCFRQGAGWAQWAGPGVGALPNGRKAWTTLADASASAVQGADKKGPTALFNSITKLDNMYIEGPLVNVKFSPGVLKSKEGRQKFAQLISTYFDKGGGQLQFNVLNKETLLDAQAHPENYRDLVVRIAGFSSFWVELPEVIQNDIINRTDQQF